MNYAKNMVFPSSSQAAEKAKNRSDLCVAASAILEQDIQKKKSRIKIPKKDIVTRAGASRTLIDTSGEKFKNSPGLQHWASVKNLKTAAASYAASSLFPQALSVNIVTISSMNSSIALFLLGLPISIVIFI